MRPRLGVDVAVPVDVAWDELVGLDAWPCWGPTVRAARLDDGTRRLYDGATGAVQTPLGVWVPFRVDGWRVGVGGRAWSWRVAGVPATEHVVRWRGPTSCRVEMSVPWWAVPYLAVVAVGLTRIRRRAMTGTVTGPHG